MAIQSFISLIAWQKGHELVLDIYKITKKFPIDEKFCLIDQMRRCGVSVTSNIAEGFSRKSYKEKIHFYAISLGSTTELQNQLIISKDLKYISLEEFESIYNMTVEIHKIINGLISGARKFLKA